MFFDLFQSSIEDSIEDACYSMRSGRGEFHPSLLFFTNISRGKHSMNVKFSVPDQNCIPHLPVKEICKSINKF